MNYGTPIFARRISYAVCYFVCLLPLVLKAYLVGVPQYAPTNFPYIGTLTFTNGHDTNFLNKFGKGWPNSGSTGNGFSGYGLSAGGLTFSGSPFHQDTGGVLTVTSPFHASSTYTNTENTANDRSLTFTYQYYKAQYSNSPVLTYVKPYYLYSQQFYGFVACYPTIYNYTQLGHQYYQFQSAWPAIPATNTEIEVFYAKTNYLLPCVIGANLDLSTNFPLYLFQTNFETYYPCRTNSGGWLVPMVLDSTHTNLVDYTNYTIVFPTNGELAYAVYDVFTNVLISNPTETPWQACYRFPPYSTGGVLSNGGAGGGGGELPPYSPIITNLTISAGVATVAGVGASPSSTFHVLTSGTLTAWNTNYTGTTDGSGNFSGTFTAPDYVSYTTNIQNAGVNHGLDSDLNPITITNLVGSTNITPTHLGFYRAQFP